MGARAASTGQPVFLSVATTAIAAIPTTVEEVLIAEAEMERHGVPELPEALRAAPVHLLPVACTLTEKQPDSEPDSEVERLMDDDIRELKYVADPEAFSEEDYSQERRRGGKKK